MFMPFTVTQGTPVHFMIVCLTLFLGSVNDRVVFVFFGDAHAHHSEWLESVSPTDRHGSDALDFCN